MENAVKANAATSDLQERQRDIWRMFDRIASRYDLANHLLSFGQDIRWRAYAGGFLPAGVNLRVLDLASGTGDLALAFARYRERVASITATDMSDEMLSIGYQKVRARKLERLIHLQKADAAGLPFADETFDCVSIAFGIRNICRPEIALAEMRRVLKPNGRALIMEFSIPRQKIFQALYLAYFRHALPVLGGIISGDFEAYRYLNKTAEKFPSGEAFIAMLRRAGFDRVEARELSFGIATIYSADKIDIAQQS